MKWLSDPSVVSKTPLVSVALLETANMQQLWRMWSEHSALGQSLGGWISVNIALFMWCNFYRVCCPKEKFAFWATVLSIGMNSCVILTVIHFRMLGK